VVVAALGLPRRGLPLTSAMLSCRSITTTSIASGVEVLLLGNIIFRPSTSA
jgi:hypothetical protein